MVNGVIRENILLAVAEQQEFELIHCLINCVNLYIFID